VSGALLQDGSPADPVDALFVALLVAALRKLPAKPTSSEVPRPRVPLEVWS
jgi:hypothetical protein